MLTFNWSGFLFYNNWNLQDIYNIDTCDDWVFKDVNNTSIGYILEYIFWMIFFNHLFAFVCLFALKCHIFFIFKGTPTNS